MFFSYWDKSIYYRYFGGKQPVLFLHGWGGSTFSMLASQKNLESYGIPTLSLDFLGFGQSDDPPENFGMQEYADSVVALIKHLKLDKVDIVAHSFGARVAIILSAQHPELVNTMVITGGAGLKPKRGIRYCLKVMAYKRAKSRGKDVSRFGSADYVALSPLMRQVFVKVVNYDLKKLAKLIKCDTLLIWGKCDRDTPMYMARRFKRYMKNSALIVFEDAGHFAYIEQHDRFCRILRSFYASRIDSSKPNLCDSEEEFK